MGNFLMGVLGGLVSIAIAGVLKYGYPRLSDYWSAMSARRTRKKIARLQEKLSKYESDFADIRLFFCRITFKCTQLIFCGLFGIFSLVYVSFDGIAMTLDCVASHNCNTHDIVLRNQTFTTGALGSYMFWVWFFLTLMIIVSEISPEKYIAQLKERISTLEKKLMNVPPSEEAAA